MTELALNQSPDLFAATRDGLFAILVGDGEPQVLPWGVYGRAIRSVATDDKGVLLAVGTRDGGVLTTSDGARFEPASGLDRGEVARLACDGRRVFAARSPTSLLRSDDGGKGFAQLERFEGPWRDEWAKAAPDDDPVRISAILVRQTRVAVAVKHGGVLLSESAGAEFRRVSDGLPAGVLGLAAPAGDDGLVLAATTEGLYRSTNLGATAWRHVYTPRDRFAVTAVAFDPRDPQRVICGASRALQAAKPGRPAGADAWLYVSSDGGQSWAEVASGMLPILRGRVTSIVYLKGRVFVGTSAGELFESRDAGTSFHLATATLAGVDDLVAGPGPITG